MEIIEKYPDKPWDWYDGICRNPNITMEFIEKHRYDHWWDWERISCNPNVTMEIIEKHPDKPWKWGRKAGHLGISNNPNITLEFIEKHLDKICFQALSHNKFTFENNRMNFPGKESYVLLEKERSFHKLMNLYVVNQYM